VPVLRTSCVRVQCPPDPRIGATTFGRLPRSNGDRNACHWHFEFRLQSRPLTHQNRCSKAIRTEQRDVVGEFKGDAAHLFPLKSCVSFDRPETVWSVGILVNRIRKTIILHEHEEIGVHADTKNYNAAQATSDRAICKLLAEQIDRELPEAENKVWHAHPVWFLDGNPVVGYSKLKNCVRLLFWSGQSFEEDGLKKEGSFKAAEARYTAVDEVDTIKLERWLAEARDVQWDYKNLIRRKGRLERLK
jgi:hypothetical protein